MGGSFFLKIFSIFSQNPLANHTLCDIIYATKGESQTTERRNKMKMTDQEMLEYLSERECRLFYEYSENPTEETEKAHKAARALLEDFARKMGILA